MKSETATKPVKEALMLKPEAAMEPVKVAADPTIGKSENIEVQDVEVEEPMQLTAEECATLKRGVFQALEAELDQAYRVIAVKDLN